MDVDKQTGKPVKEKMSKLSVFTEQDGKKRIIAEAQLDIAGFDFEAMKKSELDMTVVDDLDGVVNKEETTRIEIGLKGSKADGLVAKRMSELHD